MKGLGKPWAFAAAVLLVSACEPDGAPLGPRDETDPVSPLATLTCTVDVAGGTMRCGPAAPRLGDAGASADLIVGSQHQFVRMANDTPSTAGGVWSTDVTVQNLTLQSMGTTDGTAVSPTGVRVFFVDLPNNGVVVSNADGSAAFTGSEPQLFYTYADSLLGADSILSPGETSAAKEWRFTLNGATTFRFSVLVSTEVPDVANYGVHLTGVTGGRHHTCGDASDGRVFCWGDNDAGRLGDGTETNRSTPAAVANPIRVTLSGVAAGVYHTCANGSDNNIYCWGASYYGQLGNGATGDGAFSATPMAVSVAGLPGVSLSGVTTGEYHACATGSDTSIYCWGRGNAGQLGNNGTATASTPAPVSAPAGVTLTGVSAGYNHTCAIGSDDNAYCWGSNAAGQLGDSTTNNALTPVRVQAPAGVTFTSISAAVSHTCAIGSNGTTYCWGDNSSGQLGDGTTTPALVPVAVAAAAQFVAVDGGYRHTCGLDTIGDIWCWGANDVAQVGASTLGGEYHIPTQVVDPVASLTYTGFDAGYQHSCAVGSDGRTYCWGSNSERQLGDGRTTNGSVSPQPVAKTRRPE